MNLSAWVKGVTAMRKLPIGIQDFEKLRTGGFVYADKTDFIHKLAAEGSGAYFLGRPRRFGKSLLISTMEAYFQGKRELFQGLKLEGLEKDWTEYPVFYFDLSGAKYDQPGTVDKKLGVLLKFYENIWGNAAAPDPPDRLLDLLRKAHQQTGRRAVVLMDEYDKPLLESINDQKLNEDHRGSLRAFYSMLKNADRHLRFVFLTGVTKFSQVSDLNQLNDISMDKKYAGICGISLRELEDDFGPELRELAEASGMSRDEAVAEMKKRYDGYHFCENTAGIFNPFSVLNTLAKQKFKNYWFQTGTPTFLIKLLEQSNFTPHNFACGIEIRPDDINDYRADEIDPVPILYQSGYLTIAGYDENTNKYTLDFPNEEVRQGFFNELLRSYMLKPVSYADKFKETLLKGDLNGFIEYAKTLLRSIPYDLNNKAAKAAKEGYYHELFYIMLTVAGLKPKVEERTAVGRSDLVVETKNMVYIFEFKLDKSADEALRQIDEKAYAAPYALAEKKIVKIGVNFTSQTRNIGDWKASGAPNGQIEQLRD
jgi:hypothetical protein